MTSRQPDRLELALAVHAETDAALLVSETGERGNAVWLPKSQIETSSARIVDGLRVADVTLPEWLAIEKGFA